MDRKVHCETCQMGQCTDLRTDTTPGYAGFSVDFWGKPWDFLWFAMLVVVNYGDNQLYKLVV